MDWAKIAFLKKIGDFGSEKTFVRAIILFLVVLEPNGLGLPKLPEPSRMYPWRFKSNLQV